MFKKLDLILPKLDISKIKGDFFEGYGETFLSFTIKDIDYFNEIISTRIKFNIAPSWVCYTEISGYGAGPHVDHSKTALNYYIDPANGVTIFWKSRTPKDGNTMLQQQQDGRFLQNEVKVYDPADLMPVTNFVAKADEAFLLDIKQIHSVPKFANSITRTMIRWLWDDHSFEQVMSSVEILSNTQQR